MPPQFPSIQSFFSPSPAKPSSPAPSPVKRTSSSATLVGDGFTPAEIERVVKPPSHQWTPTQDYEEIDIGDLTAGPKCCTFMGRIVNLYDQRTPSKRSMAAEGFLKLIVADDTGALTVRLWYGTAKYQFHLGHLVTIWTVHISHGEHGSLASSTAPLFTSIFPERDRSCHIMLHENSDDGRMCRKPYGLQGNQELPGLMTLKNFIEGGYDVDDCKILVCVKSIGARKKFTNKKGIARDSIHIGIFDDTAEANLTLWDVAATSASSWQPSWTVLLISKPGWHIDRRTWISMNSNTRVDIDPEFNDAAWLKAFAQRLTKKEHINPPFPESAFDTGAARSSPVRILYRLSDIDQFARSNPRETFMGYISVIITELHIVSLKQRHRLMSSECCGIPLYANATTERCEHCEKEVSLRMNPRLLGPMVDETGQIATGKLVLSETAWEQLLGRSAQQLVEADSEVLRYLEQRLLFLRLNMGFGWCAEESGSPPTRGSVDEKGKLEEEEGVGKEEVGEGESGEIGASGRKRKRDQDGGGDILGERGNHGGNLNSETGADIGRLCIWFVEV